MVPKDLGQEAEEPQPVVEVWLQEQEVEVKAVM